MHDWIFAHRGCWYPHLSTNSITALENAFSSGFAIETDVRDFMGNLVISHDPCVDDEALRFQDVFLPGRRIAINIKSDGLSKLFRDYLELIISSDSFAFDCSFPESLRYRKYGIPHALRISEYERELPWTPNYLWLDSFESDWWLKDPKILKIMEKVPTVVVSPELHKRDHREVWEKIFSLRQSGVSVQICTDYPDDFLKALS